MPHRLPLKKGGEIERKKPVTLKKGKLFRSQNKVIFCVNFMIVIILLDSD